MEWARNDGQYWQAFFMEDGAPCTVLCDDGKGRAGTLVSVDAYAWKKRYTVEVDGVRMKVDRVFEQYFSNFVEVMGESCPHLLCPVAKEHLPVAGKCALARNRRSDPWRLTRFDAPVLLDGTPAFLCRSEVFAVAVDAGKLMCFRDRTDSITARY